MYCLSEPFVNPERVLLRKNTTEGVKAIGTCHMGVADDSNERSVLVGSCHMAIVQDRETKNSLRKRGFTGHSRNREVVILGWLLSIYYIQ